MSSAAVELLFSCSRLVAISAKYRLSEGTFEKLLMLKTNQYECQWWVTTLRCLINCRFLLLKMFHPTLNVKITLWS